MRKTIDSSIVSDQVGKAKPYSRILRARPMPRLVSFNPILSHAHHHSPTLSYISHPTMRECVCAGKPKRSCAANEPSTSVKTGMCDESSSELAKGKKILAEAMLWYAHVHKHERGASYRYCSWFSLRWYKNGKSGIRRHIESCWSFPECTCRAK
jgi:hypothetical protein